MIRSGHHTGLGRGGFAKAQTRVNDLLSLRALREAEGIRFALVVTDASPPALTRNGQEIS